MFPRIKHWLAASCAAGLAVAAVQLLPDAKNTSVVSIAVPDAEAKAQAIRQYAAVPMSFERKEGQTDASVAYLSRGPGYSLFLTPGEAVFALQPARQARDPERTDAERDPGGQATDAAVIRMSLIGANDQPAVEGREPQAGKSHYLQGSDPAAWRRDVARYGKVHYQDVYPGIDLVYYGNQRELEYDFVVAPGRDPAQIALQFGGMESLRLDAAGNLVLRTALGDVIQRKPVLYQAVAGKRRPVEGSYRLLADNRVGFVVGRYDAGLPLVIDPIFVFTSYLGGSGGDQIVSLAVDKDANLYALGCTSSLNFPVVKPMKATFAGGTGCDVFVSKFNSDLNGLVYSTYLGGTGDDVGLGIEVDGSGNVVVAGHTDSANFPMKSALQPALLGGRDGFIFKLNAAGNALVYSTYLGGSEDDWGLALAMDPGGNAYVVGATLSANFPTQGSISGNVLNGVEDAFLTKINAAGSAIVLSRYFGGSDDDLAYGVDVDANGNAYVTGMTQSTDFPTVLAIQSFAGGNDAFVTKFGSDGAFVYSTYLGSTYMDAGRDIAVDYRGRAVVVGTTWGRLEDQPFPITEFAAQAMPGGGADGFVASLHPDGFPLVFSTYLGGSGDDDMREVEVDRRGSVYVVGYTASSDVPGTNPNYLMQAASGGGDDAFVARYHSSGAMMWSTYLGGSGNDYGYAIALYGTGNIFVAGSTASTNLPVRAPLQATSGGGTDAYVARLAVRSYLTMEHEFNGDYFSDILWRNSSTGENVIWRSAAAAYQTVTRTSPAMQVAGVADFNCDAKADILWRDSTTGANTIWLSANSATPKAVTAVTNLAWYVAAVGDFNYDCEADIIWRNATNGTNALWLSGDYANQGSITNVTNRDWKIHGVGDFNGDTVFDILWRNEVTGANAIWLDGDYARQQPIQAVHAGWKIAGIGDFLGDGRSDVLWRNPTSGDNVIWRQGDYNDQQRLPWVNPEWAVAAVADYNNDGRSDILWRNGRTGQNSIWRSGSPTNTQAATAVTNFAWKVVP